MKPGYVMLIFEANQNVTCLLKARGILHSFGQDAQEKVICDVFFSSVINIRGVQSGPQEMVPYSMASEATNPCVLTT